MIGYLQGTIIFKEDSLIILLVGGVGYRVFLLERKINAHAVHSECSLFIFPYVREGNVELYGFDHHDDLHVFERLISVSGVGPKSAFAILRLASSDDICIAIQRGDADLLKKVSGVGNKTAQRIIIELKNVFDRTREEVGSVGMDSQDLVDALVRLGYSRVAAREALSHVPATVETPSERIRHALKYIQ
ncbi:Holliday junction branch migration protein RuvA [Candidatus Uhrbacteria bacterium]|nr:Holliday junction branch migration protein RuvA [Candidatus Uhrbacteria bacterium]